MTQLKSLRLFCCSFLMAAFLSTCCTTIASAAPQSATASTPQTVTDANGYQLLARIVVGKLEDIYGVPLTFEDTRHANEAEIDKRTPMTYMPERVSITYVVTPPPPGADLSVRKAMAGEVLRDVVQKYNAARGTEMYRITETEKGFHVVPRQFLNASGKMEEFQPLLDTPVTVAPGERTVSDVLDQISEQISSVTGGYKSFTISFPGGNRPHFLTEKTTLSASNEPARSVLDRLFKGIQTGPDSVSWELNSVPGPVDGGIMYIEVVKPPGGWVAPPAR